MIPALVGCVGVAAEAVTLAAFACLPGWLRRKGWFRHRSPVAGLEHVPAQPDEALSELAERLWTQDDLAALRRPYAREEDPG